MSTKTMKIVVGVLIAAVIVVGGLAVTKSMGVFAGASGNLTEEKAGAQGEMAAELTMAPAAGPDTGASSSTGE